MDTEKWKRLDGWTDLMKVEMKKYGWVRIQMKGKEYCSLGMVAKNTVLKKLNSPICNFKKMRVQSNNREDIN